MPVVPPVIVPAFDIPPFTVALLTRRIPVVPPAIVPVLAVVIPPLTVRGQQLDGVGIEGDLAGLAGLGVLFLDTSLRLGVAADN